MFYKLYFSIHCLVFSFTPKYNERKILSMQTFYCKFLHQEKVPRMFLNKGVLEQPILNRKYMPWTLNQQICNRKVEVPIEKSNKKGRRKMLNLSNLQYCWNAKKNSNFLFKIKIIKTKVSNWILIKFSTKDCQIGQGTTVCVPLIGVW